MKKTLILAGSLLAAPAFADDLPMAPEAVSASYAAEVQANQTYTYVRCWYRPTQNHDDPSTDWEWARDDNGDYYTIDGYWWSSVSFKNMFYTNATQTDIENRCKETLGVNHDSADLLYYASDNRFSYNHSILSLIHI